MMGLINPIIGLYIPVSQLGYKGANIMQINYPP